MNDLNEPFKPLDRLVIQDREQLRVLLHPLRARIVTALAGTALSVKELAGILDLPPTKLYYHLRLLEKAGLVVAVGERRVGNLTECSYSAAAREFDVNRLFEAELASGRDDPFEGALRSILGAAQGSILRSYGQRQEARRSKAEKGTDKSFTLGLSAKRLLPEEAKAFQARLSAITEEFCALADRPEPEALPFELLIAFYPGPGAGKEKHEAE
jgi:DNA-binding transcriptional ArsR family regulator